MLRWWSLAGVVNGVLGLLTKSKELLKMDVWLGNCASGQMCNGTIGALFFYSLGAVFSGNWAEAAL